MMGDTASFRGTSNGRLRVGLAAPPTPEPCLPPPPLPSLRPAFSPLPLSPQNKQQEAACPESYYIQKQYRQTSHVHDIIVLMTPLFTQHLSPEPKALFRSKFQLRWVGNSVCLNTTREAEFKPERGKVD